MTKQDSIQKQIDLAVSRALLYHFSPNGGQFGTSTIGPRIRRVIDEGVTEESLLTLLTETAKRSAEEADRTLGFALHSLWSQATKQAERSDSLSFHRYVETLRIRIEERGEDTTDKSIQDQIDFLTKKEDQPLDPVPWEDTFGRRFTGTFPRAGRGFAPRPQYEQDKSKYPVRDRDHRGGTLDPEPWVGPFGDRDHRGGTLWDFKPREQYEQDRSKYPEVQQ